MRYFIELSYSGKNYHGWQVQPNAISVQQKLNEALSTVLRSHISVVGAGRTDTGVHARQMYAHFDVDYPVEENLKRRLNSILPPDIAILSITAVNNEAHARFDATQRSYEYHISTRKDPFLRDYAWLVYNPLDMENMQQAAEILFEYSDFSSFSRSNTQTKTNSCRIDQAVWKQNGSQLVFHVSADRFLRNMVRAIVGTLVEVGRGRKSLEQFRNIIEEQDRRKAGESAPAHGLFLTEVKYPKEIFEWQMKEV